MPFKVAVKSPVIACVLFLPRADHRVHEPAFPNICSGGRPGAMTGGIMVSAASMFDIFLNPAVVSHATSWLVHILVL
ncbi:MAG: hypothetical protein ACLTMP_06325 [Eggerthella lenta]